MRYHAGFSVVINSIAVIQYCTFCLLPRNSPTVSLIHLFIMAATILSWVVIGVVSSLIGVGLPLIEVVNGVASSLVGIK